MVSKSNNSTEKYANEYTTLKKRIEAIGEPVNDPALDLISANAEALYIPKCIRAKDDWLAIKREFG